MGVGVKQWSAKVNLVEKRIQVLMRKNMIHMMNLVKVMMTMTSRLETEIHNKFLKFKETTQKEHFLRVI